MKILKNLSLLPYNTFKINALANEMVVIENDNELENLHLNQKPFLVLGGGSNILFTKNFDGIILKNEIKGKAIIDETEEEIALNIKSGENWHEIVMWSVENNWNGIENLALIPGTVGAAPVQNIGAYGVEIKDVLQYVRFYNFETRKFEQLNNSECQFGYRDSIFKRSLKNKIFITDIGIKLKKKNHHYKTDYGNIKDELKKQNISELSPRMIANIVIQIRKSKLPDPAEIGNAGSFFKNPEVSEEVLSKIKNQFPNVIYFPTNENRFKLAAGWMIEQCGLRGFEHKGAAVHTRQALVIINKQNATGESILELAQIIIEKVYQTFGVKLEPEVNIL
ncbi:MAG: UDP-N-acetylenolpyruvoylglucosamine reductase [Bacteroidia bacterium]|nr:MAG: UDP-N-acetylenolpyruvoylglucosamine reductase [Bacteroidia bacterium]